MIGKVGTVFGEHGLNIASTAVGREPDQDPDQPAGGGNGRLAVMVVTSDTPVTDEVIDSIVSIDGFQSGRAVTSLMCTRLTSSRSARARPLLRLQDRGDADRGRPRGDGSTPRRRCPRRRSVVIVDLEPTVDPSVALRGPGCPCSASTPTSTSRREKAEERRLRPGGPALAHGTRDAGTGRAARLRLGSRAMRAVVLVKHGPPEQALELREWPEPVPGDGEVLIDVAAAGLNFADIVARVGLYPDAPKPPCVMGYEVAGTVAAVGPGGERRRDRPARARGHPLQRLRRARRRGCAQRAAAAGRDELRAGRLGAGRVRNGLCRDRADGLGARGRDRAGAGRRRWGGDRGAATAARPRRRGDRHRLGVQARRLPRSRAPRTRSTTGHRT